MCRPKAWCSAKTKPVMMMKTATIWPSSRWRVCMKVRVSAETCWLICRYLTNLEKVISAATESQFCTWCTMTPIE